MFTFETEVVARSQNVYCNNPEEQQEHQKMGDCNFVVKLWPEMSQ